MQRAQGDSMTCQSTAEPDSRLDPAITPVAERLFELIGRFRGPRPLHLARDSNPEEQEQHRQRHGQMRMLVTLLREGSLTVQDLARALDVSAPTASVLAKKAFEEGLIERRGDPSDSRVVWLDITPAGRSRVLAHRAGRVQRLEQLIAGRDDLDLAELSRAVDLLIQLFTPISSEPAPPGSNEGERPPLAHAGSMANPHDRTEANRP